MIEYMSSKAKASKLRTAAAECHDKPDPTLLEIAYKCIGDGQTICDHYITVIKEDWHFWVQMLTFLQTDKTLQTFYHHNPKPQTAKYLTIAIFGVALPFGTSLILCLQTPAFLYLFLIPIMASVLLSILIAKLFNLRGNYKPDTKLQYYWPYESKEDFDSDYQDYVKSNPNLDIPLAPPNLTGRVAKVTNFLWESPRPDE